MRYSSPQSIVPPDAAAKEAPTILLLDDEVRIVETLRLILRPHYRVLAATDGDAALDLLRKHPVQVIISDQRMPRMTGVEFLRQARTLSPASVRILLTGFSDLQAIIDSVNEGEVFRFLNKPWGNAELLAVVRDAVEVSRQLDTRPALDALAKLARQEAGSPFIKTPVSSSSSSSSSPRPSASCTQGTVLIKTSNHGLFDQIRRTQPESINLLYASSLDEALTCLSRQRATVFGTHFESVESAYEEALALKILKRDMPTLLTIALVHNADANEVISLINQGRVFRLVTLPCKATIVGFYIQSALRQSQALAAMPQFLGTQRAAALGETEESRSAGLFSRIGSICKRWLGG
ncbi:MAG: response regulator [Zoogloeaceae bacterium]|jgi:serine/threonine-protein kinase|nr:response regulator [Zoogloeaceae bacterium]